MSRRKIEKRIPSNAKGLANALNILHALNKAHKIRLEPDALAKTFHFAAHHVALGAAIAEHPTMKPLALKAIDAVLGRKAAALAGVDGMMLAELGFLHGFVAGVAQVAELEGLSEECVKCFVAGIEQTISEHIKENQ